VIKGIGTDLVLVSRIRSSLDRFGDRFAQKILAEKELVDFAVTRAPEYFLAKRFAAKEAVSKALGTGMRHGVTFRTIQISHDVAGKPQVNLVGDAAGVAEKNGIVHLHISLSDERDHALAFVVAETR
jgi:holo-[acyl-carrier protein] synthase